MSVEENKLLVKNFYAAIERMDFEALHDMVHEDFVFYPQVDSPHPGVQGLAASEKASFESFESFRFPVVEMVAEGDKVAAYMYFEGKGFRNPDSEIPARGQNIRISLFHLLTIKDGKIIEKRAHFDHADVANQLASQI